MTINSTTSRRRATTFWVACLVVLACKITERSSSSTAPPRPAGVPEAAVWSGGEDGGMFIVLTKQDKAGLFQVDVYWDVSGELETRELMKLSSGTERDTAESLLGMLNGWDGTRIHLADGRHLSPLGKAE